MKNNIEVIGFDADDTLWVNENYYREAEDYFAELLSDYGEKEELKEELFQTEMKNLELFGYGIKPFVISLIETAIRISDGKVSNQIISTFINTGREMLQKPIELLPGVKEVLSALHGKYRLIVATKGDLLDQEGKLKRSSLSGFFHHIEVMSDKTRDSYQELLDHLDLPAEKFLMIGNSLRSDILPPYELGSKAIYVPYHMTWAHEMNVKDLQEDERYKKVDKLIDVLSFFE